MCTLCIDYVGLSGVILNRNPIQDRGELHRGDTGLWSYPPLSVHWFALLHCIGEVPAFFSSVRNYCHTVKQERSTLGLCTT